MKKTIFLSGRIEGLTYKDATWWRINAKDLLEWEYEVYIPEPADSDTNGKEIWTKHYFNLDRADILLVNMDYSNDTPFIGTSIEISRAFNQNKPIIIFSSHDWVYNNKTLQYHATKICKNMNDAIKYIKQNYK